MAASTRYGDKKGKIGTAAVCLRSHEPTADKVGPGELEKAQDQANNKKHHGKIHKALGTPSRHRIPVQACIDFGFCHNS